ncbi:hypothetical protein POM88_031681 [Heracleum sosnowskyi]|uniref:RNase H type-1 domain-containing protein n=1 Tax=Heracleum sosnowskyi TaxID=360622 RepID=A0AAD8HYP9_9APIA|nr:hypothetical protein POM88_031681 [Heracleum sosnowskyi]
MDDLGAAIRNKNASASLLGISSIKNIEGFSGALDVNEFMWDMNDGSTALFWEDKWLESCALYQSFSRLYLLSKIQNVSVQSFCDTWMNPQTESHMLWNRQLRDWELDEAVKLNTIIDSIVFSPGLDSLAWLKSKHPYSSADGKGMLLGSSGSTNVVWSRIWKLKLRAQKWCQTASILRSDHITIWNVHPLRAVSRSSNVLFRAVVDMNYKLIGFSDGSFKIDSNGAISANEPFPNGNRSGIGGAIRDHRGMMLRLFAGSLGMEDIRENEFYAMFKGLIRAYLAGMDVVELETDNLAAHWEWDNSLNNGIPQEYIYVVQQFNQRKADINLFLVTRASIGILTHCRGTWLGTEELDGEIAEENVEVVEVVALVCCGVDYEVVV